MTKYQVFQEGPVGLNSLRNISSSVRTKKENTIYKLAIFALELDLCVVCQNQQQPSLFTLVLINNANFLWRISFLVETPIEDKANRKGSWAKVNIWLDVPEWNWGYTAWRIRSWKIWKVREQTWWDYHWRTKKTQQNLKRD